MKNNKVARYGVAALAGVSLLLSASGCAQRSQALPPAGSFRITVKDLVSDDSMQVKQIIIEKEGAGKLHVNADVERSGFSGDMGFGPGPNSRSSIAQLVFVADLVAGQALGNSNNSILRLVNQVSTSEGSSFGSATWQIPATTKSTGTLLNPIKSGVYPLGTRFELGPLAGKPITLTVSEGDE